MMLVSCKTKQEFTPYDFPGEIIVFGGGGGFTGKVYQYTLMENGQFFKGTHDEGKVTEFDSLKKREVEQFFKNYHELGFADIDLDEAANLYKFVKFRKGGKEHKIMWSDFSEGTATLKVFHDNLVALARKANKAASTKKEALPVK